MGKKLKAIRFRTPKGKVTHDDMINEVVEDSGFTYVDVKHVIDLYLEKVKESVLDRKCAKVGSIGTIYAMLRAPKHVRRMGGYGNNGSDYEKMVLPPIWQARFMQSKELIRDVGDIMVTDKDVDNLYE
jgi:nucleoid DNA-binding protein|tara:strand:- start:77 stop:460 length:384 start_codon:yes stop_codon:yes gene_type:complete